MPTTEAVDEAFWALIAADPDLLRAEFDTLVEEAWGPPPEPPPLEPADECEGPWSWERPEPGRNLLDGVSSRSSAGRERSPPHLR